MIIAPVIIVQRTDDKWGRRNFLAAVACGFSVLVIGVLAWRFPVSPTPMVVKDTPLTPGTGALRFGEVVASLDPAAPQATANLTNIATQATVNTINATARTVNVILPPTLK